MGPFFVQYIVYNLTYPRNVHLSQNSSHNFPHCTECASLSIAEHLPVITGSKPLAKPSRTGFDQLSSNHKPEPAKAAVLASWLAASRAAATLRIYLENHELKVLMTTINGSASLSTLWHNMST
jgi:hypothetical protein